jgi:hypothetical protein
MKSSIGHRAGRSTVGSLVWALLVILMITCAPNTWAEGSAGTAPGNSSAAPAAASSPPAPAAVATPVPPLTSPTMVGPLQMASPNEVNLPKYVPFLSELPAPVANLLDFDVNGVVSGIGIFQNHAVVGDFYNRLDVSNAEAIIQKADGVIQYYLQVGGYSIPALGTPYVNLAKAVNRRALAGWLFEDCSYG